MVIYLLESCFTGCSEIVPTSLDHEYRTAEMADSREINTIFHYKILASWILSPGMWRIFAYNPVRNSLIILTRM